MKSWTIDEMLRELCCRYTRERLLELWDGRERMTLLEICQHPDILDRNKVRVCCLDHEHMAQWISVIVTRCLKAHAVGTVIDAWTQRWLSGEDRTVAAAQAAMAHARAAWARAGDMAKKAGAWPVIAAAEAGEAAAKADEALSEKGTWAADEAVEAAVEAVRTAGESWASAAACAATSAAWTREIAQQVQDMIDILTKPPTEST